jgi:Aspartyl protease
MGSNIRRFAVCSFVAVGLFASGSKSCGADDGEAAPESILRNHGLKKVGKLWILPEEQQLRERLATLERSEKRHREVRAAVDQLLDANDATLARLTKLEEAVKKTRDLDAAAKAGSPQRKQIDAELKNEESAIEQLHKLYIPPDKLGASVPLKPALIDVVNARTEVTLRLLAYHDTPCDLPQRYQQLGKIPAIAAADSAGADPIQLGPQKGLCDRWRFILENFDANLLGDSLPVYRDGHAFRFTAIIDDRRPLTFTLDSVDEPALIPQNLAEAAGLPIDADAPKTTYHVSDGRDVKAQVIKIGQVRLAGHVVKSVTAYILPPEAADLGARVGPNSLPGMHLHVNAARFQIVVETSKR